MKCTPQKTMNPASVWVALRESQRVAEVRKGDDLIALVVMAQDDKAFAERASISRILETRSASSGAAVGPIFILMSSAVTEWVRLPIEMKSTPVAALGRPPHRGDQL